MALRMTEKQKAQQKNQIALDRTKETPGALERLKNIQSARQLSLQPDPTGASVGGNLRSDLLASLLQAPTQPTLDLPTAAPSLANPATVRTPGASAAGQPLGSMNPVDAAFDPLIQEAGAVEEPRTAIGDQIFPALSQAFSVAFANDPAAALQNQLLNQQTAALRRQERKDAAKERSLGLKTEKAKTGLSLIEKEKDRKYAENDEAKRWLRDQTGKESLANLRFDHEKKLFDLNVGEERAKVAGSQAFQEKLALASRGDAREGTRITNEFTLRELLPGVKPEEIKGATMRIFFSDKTNPATGKPWGDATKRDGDLIAQAHAREVANKARLSGRDDGFDPEKFVGAIYTAALKESDTKPLLKADGTISVDPFSGRPNVLPVTPEERFSNAANAANAAQEWLKARGKLTPKPVAPPAPVGTLTPQQKAAEIAVTDPDAALRAQGAAMVDSLKAQGKSDQEIISLLAGTAAPQSAKDGALARLREKPGANPK